MPVLPTTSARVQQVAKELGLAPDNPDVQTAIRFSSITGLQPTNPELLKALGLLPYSQYTTPTKEGMTQTQGTKYYGSDGSIATIGNNDTLSITDGRGKTTWYQKHQNDNEHINTKTYKNTETNSTATTHKQSIVVQNDKGQTVATLHVKNPSQSSSDSSSSSSSSSGTIIDFYPPGVSKASIPKMNEDLYILKTQLVPPVVPIGSACPLCDKPTKSATSSSKACGCPNLGNQRAKHEQENCTRPNASSLFSKAAFQVAPTLQDNMFTSSYDGAYSKSSTTKELPFDYRTLPHTFDPIPMLNSFAKF